MPACGSRRAPPVALVLLLACTASADDLATTTAIATDSDAPTSDSDSNSTTSDSTTSDAPTSDTPTSDTPTSGPDPDPLTACPTLLPPTIQSKLTDPRIAESSGLAHSRSQPDVFWVHNDSGDSARFFAVDAIGQTLATFTLGDVDPDDWEDMALGPGPTPGDWIYLGDIGDNLGERKQIAVHRLPEPDLAESGGGELVLMGAETLRLTYPDHPHDAEALLVDPVTADLVIVTKGDPTRIFRAAGPLSAVGIHLLEEVSPAVLPMVWASGGDVSPAGDFAVVRSNAQALLWLRPAGGDLRGAFASAPCIVPLAAEIQGEALAIARDGRGYFTLSEMPAPPLWRFDFE